MSNVLLATTTVANYIHQNRSYVAVRGHHYNLHCNLGHMEYMGRKEEIELTIYYFVRGLGENLLLQAFSTIFAMYRTTSTLLKCG